MSTSNPEGLGLESPTSPRAEILDCSGCVDGRLQGFSTVDRLEGSEITLKLGRLGALTPPAQADLF